MLIDTYKELTINQFEAAFCTLHLCMEHCPDESWDQPVVNRPFCHSVFHTLFFADLYLAKGMGQIQAQDFHRGHADYFRDYEELEDREPTHLYDRPTTAEYLQFCRDKANQIVAAESEEELSGPSGFDFRPCTRAELHVYNIRHIIHHTAQLSMRLRLDHGINLPWVGHAWKDD